MTTRFLYLMSAFLLFTLGCPETDDDDDAADDDTGDDDTSGDDDSGDDDGGDDDSGDDDTVVEELEIRITDDPADSTDPQLVVDGDELSVVWVDTRDGNEELYVKSSTDGGDTWGNPIRITDDPAATHYPTLTRDGSDRLHVVWRDERAGHWTGWYSTSDDGGATWAAAYDLTEYPQSFQYTHPLPSIVAEGDAIHLAWSDNRNQPDGAGLHNVHQRHSADGGDTWGEVTRLSEGNRQCQGVSLVLGAPGVLHAGYPCWDSTMMPMYRRSEDGGAVWEAVVTYSGGPIDPVGSPSLGANASGDVMALIWDNGPVDYVHSADGGQTWTEMTELIPGTNTPGYNNEKAVVFDGDDGFLAFWDEREGEGQAEVFLLLSTDGGETWGGEETVSDATGDTVMAQVQLGPGAVHLVYQDFRHDNWEIYYRRMPR